jgi:DNA polymerase zeta
MTSYRLTVCDYYLSSPIRGLDVTHSEFQGTGIKQVPVIRIFGSTLDGTYFHDVAK